MPDTISSDTASEQSTDILEEISDYETFLNEKYANATLEDFQELKEQVDQALTKINLKNQVKVRENFSKFVQCREAIHQIHEGGHISNFESTLDQIHQQIANLQERAESIEITHSEKIEEDNSLSTELKERIETLEEDLKNCMKYRDFDGFVKKYQKVRKHESEAEQVREVLKQCNPLVILFQNTLLLELESSLSADNIHYLELYKKINQKESHKIDNTILVFLKKFLKEINQLDVAETCLIYMLRSCDLTKNDFIHQQMIIEFIDWLKRIIELDDFSENTESDTFQQEYISETTSLASLDIAINELDEKKPNFHKIKQIEHVFQKLEIFNKMLKSKISVQNYSFYLSKYKNTKNLIKEKMISHISSLLEQGSVLRSYLKVISGCIPTQTIKDKIYESLEILLDLRQKNTEELSLSASESRESLRNEKKNRFRFEKANSFRKRADKLRRTLEKCNPILNNTLNFRKIDKIFKESFTFLLSDLLSSFDASSPEQFLMTILKLRENFTIDRNLIESIKNDILESKIVLYFLTSILDLSELDLDKQETEKVSQLYPLFGSLRESTIVL